MNVLRWILASVGVCPVMAVGVAGEVVLGPHRFTVPDGYVVERVSTTELVERPISASFDPRGRLYVTDSSGTNEKQDRQLLNPTHRVRRLEDVDGDGVYDRSVVFADRLAFPEGCLWHEGSVYVAVPPSIWKLTDTDDDGVCDRREEWYQGGALTGCANDVHGPYLGPDGFIYWTKGAFAPLTNVVEHTGRRVTDRAAHVFRARPDGSGLEVVMTGGMDNPVEVALTAQGDVFFTTTFVDFTQPGRRDGLCHAPLGAVFGKVHDVIEDRTVVRSGELLSPMVQYGAGAPSGLCRVEGAMMGDRGPGVLFATLFNLHKVTRHVLRRDGAGFASTDTDFLVSDNPDFHPTDVLEDADGSLLVVDTGGWYKMCCPSSQLAKADVLGGIYRVRKSGVGAPRDPRGLAIGWERLSAGQLVRLLADERPVVRARAVESLRKLGDKARGPLVRAVREGSRKGGAALFAPELAVWALAGGGKVPVAVWEECLGSGDPGVVIACLRSMGLAGEYSRRLAMKVQALLELPAGRVPVPVRAAAVEYFAMAGGRGRGDVIAGRLPAAGMTRALVAQAAMGVVGKGAWDPVLQHAVIHALVRVGDLGVMRGELQSAEPLARRAALIALSQREEGVEPVQVAGLLRESDARVREAARWVLGRNPTWGDALASWFREELKRAKTDAERTEWVGLASSLAASAGIQGLLAELLSDAGWSRAAIEAMAGAPPAVMPVAWISGVRRVLESGDVASLPSAIRLARRVGSSKSPPEELDVALMAVAGREALPLEVRLEALAARGPGRSLPAPAFALLQAVIGSERPGVVRAQAAGTLSRALLTEEQVGVLAAKLGEAGPMELGALLDAIAVKPGEALGKRCLATMEAAGPRLGLRYDQLQQWLQKFPAPVQEAGVPVLRRLNEEIAVQKTRLEEIASALPRGDIRRGQGLFNSPRAACATCHTMGYLGGKVGPDLTRIGEVRTERDLLESILFPSASFVRSYEPSVVLTRGGDQVAGIVRRDDDRGVVVMTGPGAETEVARADVAEVRSGTVSLMPAGLDQQLSREELADLLAFLKNTTWGPR